MRNKDFLLLLEKSSRVIELELKKYIDSSDEIGLSKIMEYSLLAGGKRLRPFLVLETYKMFSKDDKVEKALPYACALEMVHTYSLIHDDLPCMDNDDYRRGKPTSHKLFGEAQALLSGDSLLTYSFEVLASNELVSDRSVRLATIALSKCAGYLGMAGGQMIDISSNGRLNSFEKLKKMYALKTGELIKCAMLLGYYAYCDSPEDEVVKDLNEFALNIGIAFQIKDDILDKVSNSEELGKPIGSDEKNNKVTSLSFLSIQEAQNLVDELTKKAISIIKKYDVSSYGFYPLEELAKYLVERKK